MRPPGLPPPPATQARRRPWTPPPPRPDSRPRTTVLGKRRRLRQLDERAFPFPLRIRGRGRAGCGPPLCRSPPFFLPPSLPSRTRSPTSRHLLPPCALLPLIATGSPAGARAGGGARRAGQPAVLRLRGPAAWQASPTALYPKKNDDRLLKKKKNQIHSTSFAFAALAALLAHTLARTALAASAPPGVK